MRNSLKIVCLFFGLFIGSNCFAERTEVKACVAGFCVGDVYATEKAVVKKLGAGTRVHRPDDVGESRCYFDFASKVWADFTFAGKEESSTSGDLRGIMLSEQKMCDPREVPRKVRIGRQLAGVAIGMTEGEVRSLIGQPARIDDAKAREASKPTMADTRYSAKFGDSVYVYEKPDALGFTFIFFKDGRVRTIWFSNSG